MRAPRVVVLSALLLGSCAAPEHPVASTPASSAAAPSPAPSQPAAEATPVASVTAVSPAPPPPLVPAPPADPCAGADLDLDALRNARLCTIGGDVPRTPPAISALVVTLEPSQPHVAAGGVDVLRFTVRNTGSASVTLHLAEEAGIPLSTHTPAGALLVPRPDPGGGKPRPPYCNEVDCSFPVLHFTLTPGGVARAKVPWTASTLIAGSGSGCCGTGEPTPDRPLPPGTYTVTTRLPLLPAAVHAPEATASVTVP